MVEYVSEPASAAVPGDTRDSVSAEVSGTEQSRSRRSRRRPGENRERLLAAGLIEFGTHGFRGAATSQIAERADVPQPHIYSSFATKHELFLECLARTVDTLLTSNTVPVHAQSPSDAVKHTPDWNEASSADSSVIAARMVFQAIATIGTRDSLGEAIERELSRLRAALDDGVFEELIQLATNSYFTTQTARDE